MTEGPYVTFEARIEPLVWGRATYTILRLPPDVSSLLAGTKRVEGEIAEHPINLALTRVPVVDGVFLWAGQSLLDRTGVRPGEMVEVRLRPAPEDLVVIEPDVLAALGSAGLSAEWKALTPGKQRGLLYQVDSAKSPATRAKRIARLVEDLRALGQG